MKRFVIKLDDIGRDSSRPVIAVILWALENRFPVSIGAIGAYLKSLPQELVDLIKLAAQAGCVEVWNHGFKHIRYDQVSDEAIAFDVVEGDKAIRQTFGVEPAGFGFPFNSCTEGCIAVVRDLFPGYFIYETDFEGFKRVTPEYNIFADGQPNLSRFIERIGPPGKYSDFVLQAHPPRWTKAGFDEFVQCALYLIEKHGCVCMSGRDAIDSLSANLIISERPSLVQKVAANINKLVRCWDELSDDYVGTLSNFKSYFLARFSSDAQKNWHQVRSELFPYRPKKILDLGSGLGNWSLPFLFSGECCGIILNDINATITRALNDGISRLPDCKSVQVSSDNLISTTVAPENRVDFLVSANTFNYLDPVDYFRFAQNCVVPDGRMLLMVQTPAFNQLRYRLALESKDRNVMVEVLRSEFVMLLRRYYGMFPVGVRHVFPVADINRLANMFDFSLLSQFAPYGESKEDGEYVYECLLFRKTMNVTGDISSRPEWLEQCKSSMLTTFGSKALECAGVPVLQQSKYFNYDGEWVFNTDLPDGVCCSIREIKNAIEAIKGGFFVNRSRLEAIESESIPLSGVAKRIMAFFDR